MFARRRQQRTAVASACGSVTAATATLASKRLASSGVSMLPIPNPTTEAVAPDRTAMTKMRSENQIIYMEGVVTS